MTAQRETNASFLVLPVGFGVKNLLKNIIVGDLKHYDHDDARVTSRQSIHHEPPS